MPPVRQSAPVAFVDVGQSGSTIRADARASFPSPRGARASRLALLGRTLKRGVPARHYRLIINFSARARRRLATLRKARITVRITLTAPNGASASVTRRVTLKR